MNSSSSLMTGASSTSKPPCSDALTGDILAVEQLTVADRNAMYALFAAYFVVPDRALFDADLNEKEQVLLLRERATHHVQGFSTLLRLRIVHQDRTIHALFSGDTIVHPRFWGESLLSRLWASAAFAEADRLALVDPEAEVFWFLICSGYKTFRFLPVFFRDFYPHPQPSTGAALKPVLDALGTARYGARYDAVSGIVRLAGATPLRAGIAELTEQRLHDPMVRFFAERNPNHTAGEELACITRLTRDNLTPAGKRILQAAGSAA